MKARYSFLLAASLAATLTTGAQAQLPENAGQVRPTNAEARGVIRTSHATVDAASGFEGFGHAFKATFGPGRLDFLPALGKDAPRNFPLSFTLESIQRGGTLIHAVEQDVMPTRTDDLVTYVRGATIEERYEVSADGVHQSFLFESLPAGSGDLVVRGLLSTELTPQATPDGGLFFGQADLGGVRFGAVTGIDANGLSAAGSLRTDGHVLELVLPGAFVDAAVFPLLLDPLIGAEIAIEDSPASDTSPDIASSGFGYLVVWERNFSLAHGEVYAQRLTSSGTLSGGLLPVISGAGIIAREPAAGYVTAESTYLVAYSYSPNIFVQPQVYCTNVPSSVFGGGVSGAVAVAPGSPQFSPDVGGDLTGTDNEAFVVWQETGVGARGRTVTATEGGNPTPIGIAFTVDATGPTYDPIDPKVSKGIRNGTNFLVVWERYVSGGSRRFVYGRMYNRNGGALTNVTSLYNNATLYHAAPDCDGDGDSFLAAWQRSEGIASSDFDIVCKAITWTGSSMKLNSIVRPIEENDNDNETAPSVAMTKSNAIVSYLDVDGSSTNVYLKNVDPFTGIPTGEVALTSGITASETNVAPRSSTNDDVLVVWDDIGAADVFGQRYDGVGDSNSFGGGCGVEGRAVVPGALAGNSDFRIHLRDATPGVLAACVTGVSTFPIACGTCTLWPNVEVVYYDNTDSDGNASVNIPLPPNYGDLTFYSQWVTFVPVGACPLAPIDFTDAMQTTIDSNP